MAITKTRVTGSIALPDGTIPKAGRVIFAIKGWDADMDPDGGIVLPAPVACDMGDAGEIDVELFTNSEGLRGVVYSVSLEYLDERLRRPSTPLGPISLVGTGPHALRDLLQLPVEEPTAPDVLAQVIAIQDIVDASVAEASGYASAAATSASSAGGAATAAGGFATAASDSAAAAAGLIGKAETAVQPGDLGTAAARDVGAFASAEQGGLADTAVQPAEFADGLSAKVAYSDGVGRDDARSPAEYDDKGVILREYDEEGSVRFSRDIYGAGGALIDASSPGHVAADEVFPIAFDTQGRAILVLHPESVRRAYKDAPPAFDTDAIVSRRDIAIWSDSMAAAGSGWGPDHFAPLFGDRSVTTFGYGGRTAQSIGRYQGSYPVTVEAVTIPVTGGVAVVPDGSWINDGQSTPATLSEVSGVVSRSGSTYTFTRNEAGDEVIVAAGARLYINTGDAHRAHTSVFVSGRNNINYTDGDDFALQGVVDVNIGMVEHLTPLSKHFVFCGVTSKADERSDGTASEQEELRKVNRFNELMRRAVGEVHYVDLQDYMVNRALFEAINDGLLDNGTYPTSQDLLDIASGTVPVTLRSDGTHYSDIGKTMAAKHVHRQILAKGY
ncbi:MAG: hypothetical protein GYB51_06885 [Rhodobacteraceae bacterium]|nr:hypothetical protein [Paracoccaceae bacterium]